MLRSTSFAPFKRSVKYSHEIFCFCRCIIRFHRYGDGFRQRKYWRERKLIRIFYQRSCNQFFLIDFFNHYLRNCRCKSIRQNLSIFCEIFPIVELIFKILSIEEYPTETSVYASMNPVFVKHRNILDLYSGRCFRTSIGPGNKAKRGEI